MQALRNECAIADERINNRTLRDEVCYIATVVPDKVLRRCGSSLITSGLVVVQHFTKEVRCIGLPIFLYERSQAQYPHKLWQNCHQQQVDEEVHTPGVYQSVTSS
jgi:hypothetical protein